MPLVLVPIPSSELEGWSPHWLPYIAQIAERTKQSQDQLIGQILSCEVHLHLAWEPETKTAQALAGSRIILRGNDRIGELIWMTGIGRKRWLHLLDDLERHHRDELGCVAISAVCRPGWFKDLKAKGYRVTHLSMERAF